MFLGRVIKKVVLLLLLIGESVDLDEALVSAESPAMLLPPLAAEPLSLRLGGEDVHLVLLGVLGL